MELIFNDKSLTGQFNSISDFCTSTSQYLIPCFYFCELYGCSVSKSYETFNARITKSMTLNDALKRCYGYPELSKLRSMLINLTCQHPFWEECKKTPNSVQKANCITEAFYRNEMLLSYKGGGFDDDVVRGSDGTNEIEVINATEKRQLLRGFNHLDWFNLNVVQVIEGTSIRIEVRASETPHFEPHVHFSNGDRTDCVYYLKTFSHKIGKYSIPDKRIIDDWISKRKNRIVLIENWNYYHPDKVMNYRCE